MQKLLILFILSLILFNSCSFFQKDKNTEDIANKVIASVQDYNLYEKDIENLFKNNPTKEDSIIIRKDFINKWITEQLIFKKALLNLTDEEKDKTKKLDKYYQSLIKYEYEKKLVQQRLDDNITQKDIEEYFNANKEKFKLKKCLVRLIFLKVPLDAPEITKLRKWYKSDKIADRDFLHLYCLKNANLFSLDDTKWFYFNELKIDLNFSNNTCRNIYSGANYETQDSLFHYFASIKEIKKEGDIPPIEFEKERIESIILHKRSTELIHTIEGQIFNEGLKKNYFNIYE
ncbi:MAG: hypothetical protein U9R42_14955 [Bacteroidota bacterium]|nr:hypothetical protein [Bacteroidota bacterium]